MQQRPGLSRARQQPDILREKFIVKRILGSTGHDERLIVSVLAFPALDCMQSFQRSIDQPVVSLSLGFLVFPDKFVAVGRPIGVVPVGWIEQIQFRIQYFTAVFTLSPPGPG